MTAQPRQELVIPDWLPPQVANGSHGHWATRRRNHERAKTMAWASARHAGWERVTGKARLTVTLIFAQQRRRDVDNLYARVKGVVDGLKPFIVDDSMDWLELVVRAEVQPRTRATRLILELLPSAQASGLPKDAA